MLFPQIRMLPRVNKAEESLERESKGCQASHFWQICESLGPPEEESASRVVDFDIQFKPFEAVFHRIQQQIKIPLHQLLEALIKGVDNASGHIFDGGFSCITSIRSWNGERDAEYRSQRRNECQPLSPL
jgi:hypothetical protein